MAWKATPDRGPGVYWVRSAEGDTYCAIVWTRGQGVTCVGSDGDVNTYPLAMMGWAKQWRYIEQPE